ncbi:hypothetical protein OKW43_001396 [Paraburkholderia sp. WC7.3g]|uniref:DUF707 domain-containing protein n=1 Tax=Paraburkholderia podalyriae TaxID=1938811 RepID=A0ABR7PN55_9BURK|nr:DUF707 domain-containing protein [Paraburkholderia podalyriae]MBC8747233.1 DUF707 domain-containing protein [Paraburkholderia podalyriae]
MKKYLVVLRCGDRSLHPQWFSGGKTPSFDLMLSYYGNNENYADVFAKTIHRFKGTKWEGLHDFMLRNAQSISQYRYIWLPDDDILTDVQTLNEFFEYVDRENFALAQPSLDERSYFSHSTTLQNRAFEFRETNFVEVMVPCFSSNALHAIKDSFERTKTGWGLDYLWPKQVASLGKVGIVDRFAVFHTRPVASADHSMAWSELNQTLGQYGMRASIKVRRGRTRDAGKTYASGRLGNPTLFIHAVKGSHPVRRKNVIAYMGLLKEYLPWLHYTKRKTQPYYRAPDRRSSPLK